MKSKCLLEQEFVVGGFTTSSDGEDRIGSLLLGYYRDGELVYAGRTGTGFTQKLRRSLRGQLDPMRVAKMALCGGASGRKTRCDMGEAGAGGAGEVCDVDGG